MKLFQWWPISPAPRFCPAKPTFQEEMCIQSSMVWQGGFAPNCQVYCLQTFKIRTSFQWVTIHWSSPSGVRLEASMRRHQHHIIIIIIVVVVVVAVVVIIIIIMIFIFILIFIIIIFFLFCVIFIIFIIFILVFVRPQPLHRHHTN